MFKCERCGNQDERFLGFINNKPYCRKCINFNGKFAFKDTISENPILTLNYTLSDEQIKISKQIALARKKHQNIFLYAVTGAGKTELVYNAILDTLKEGGIVGFTVPRKDVVIDLFPRFKSAFPNNKITAVYGGHNDSLQGDIILLTTHQLFRYKKYFDLLVFDEIDAFPYEGNDVLHEFFLRAIKGTYILMSATPKQNKINDVVNSGGVYLSLTRRYHGYDLPVPKLELTTFGLFPLLLKYLNLFIKQKKQVFIFTATIEDAEKLYKILKMFVKDGNIVHSKRENREQIICDFKLKKYDYLVTTSILERGVTVSNLQVIIYKADHELYDSSTLIQISGRVGRKADAPSGEVVFLANKSTIAIEQAINKIVEANRK